MARRAVIHIGMPRTGTTAFQLILHRHRAELAARGLLYPDLTARSGPTPALNHQHLGEALDGRRPVRERSELLESLRRQVRESEAEIVLVSYEGLCLLPRRHRGPSELRALFDSLGFAMETLLTVRPQAEWINSQYAWRTQFLREGRAFRAAFPSDLRSRRLDYLRLLAPWLEASNGGVRAVPVRDARSGDPMARRILAELSLDEVGRSLLTPPEATEVANRSPGPVAVEVSRRLRRAGAHLAVPSGAVRQVTDGIERAARARGLDGEAFNGVDAGMGEAARQRFLAANERFGRTLWGESWASRVTEGASRPVNELATLGPDETTEGAIRDIIEEMSAQHAIAPGSALRRRARHAAAAGLAGARFFLKRARSLAPAKPRAG